MSPGVTSSDSPSLSSPRYSGLNIPTSDAVSRLATDHGHQVTLPSAVEINLCSLQPIAKPTLLLQEVKCEQGAPAAPPAHLQPHISFAPVNQASPHNNSLKTEIKAEPEDLSVVKKKKVSSSYAWPGVEAILESYRIFTAG